MGMYHPNPPRRCGGSKQEDAYYLEGGDFIEDGALHAWTWLLGDGLNRYIGLSKQEVPPRQVVGVNPIMTILFENYIPADGPPLPVPEDKKALYEQLVLATKTPGVADHVGDQFYSAWNFYLETAQFGPSRRVPKQVAVTLGDLINRFGPLPMMFAHSKIPLFRNEKEMARAMSHVDKLHDIDFGLRYMFPTWTHDNWGQYARRDHWIGSTHFMIPILGVIDDLKENWQQYKDIKEWQVARDFFANLRYVKQTFGMGWLCKISYTLPSDGEPDGDAYDIPGINIIDLEQVGEFDGQAEEAPMGAD